MKKATFYIAFSIGAPMFVAIYFQIKKTKRGKIEIQLEVREEI